MLKVGEIGRWPGETIVYFKVDRVLAKDRVVIIPIAHPSKERAPKFLLTGRDTSKMADGQEVALPGLHEVVGTTK